MSFLDRIKPYFLNSLGHWYGQGWFIALMFLLWPFIIPPFVGIVLIAMQNLEIQNLADGLEDLESLETQLNEKNLLLTARETDFENHVREVNADLESREKSMLDRTKQNAVVLLREKYDETMKEIQKIKCDADAYCKQKTSEADGYEHSVFLKCGAIKEEMDALRLEVRHLLESRENLHEKQEVYQQKLKEYVQDELESIDNMEDGHEFEGYFSALLKKCGYVGVCLTPGSGDLGVDVIAQRWGIPFAFQCKRYSQQVGNKAVQEIFSGMHTCDCSIGVVVTNNTFTSGSVSQARKNRILLWGRKELTDMIKDSYNT